MVLKPINLAQNKLVCKYMNKSIIIISVTYKL